MGVWFARRFLRMGVRCEVIVPSFFPTKSGERVKTGKRDAMRLAINLCSNGFVAVNIGSVILNYPCRCFLTGEAVSVGLGGGAACLFDLPFRVQVFCKSLALQISPERADRSPRGFRAPVSRFSLNLSRQRTKTSLTKALPPITPPSVR